MEPIPYLFRPIGFIRTCFPEKNGTPRQGILCQHTKGRLTLEFVGANNTNPSHFLEGLEEYTHVYLLFIFDQNANISIKSKVSPPRLEGKRVGVFASRRFEFECYSNGDALFPILNIDWPFGAHIDQILLV